MRKSKYLALALAALFAAEPFLLPEATAQSAEEQRKAYEQQAQEKQKKSQELEGRIQNVSEEKRQLDEEATKAIEEHKKLKAALDETTSRMKETQSRLDTLEKDYTQKRDKLGRRVRDIYMHGQISYIDVLFGAKDFQDLLTRMDLLKRIIKDDYTLVHTVMDERDEMTARKESLEQDAALKSEQEVQARAARQIMEHKVKKQQDLIDAMKNDKAIYDQQYDELMAASKQVGQMIRASNYHVQPSGNGRMIWPVNGTITSEFGWRTHPIYGTARFHSGIDIGADYGTPIVAAANGVVSYAGWISGYGNAVIIDHGGGVSTLYGHNQSLAVGVGQQVSQGEVISYCGSTGNSTGPHCHFEVRQNGEPVSPYSYL